TGALTVGSASLSGAQLDFDLANGDADKLVVTATGGLSLSGTSNFNFTQNSPTYGRFTLIDYSGTPLVDLSNLSPATTSVNGVTEPLVTNTLNPSVDLYVPNPAEVDSQWGVNGSGTWTNNGNWTNNTAPNGADNVATFGAINTTFANVDLPGAQTVAFMN